MGKYSYAIYIFHKPFHDFIGKPLSANLGLDLRASLGDNLAYISVSTLALFFVGWASYNLLEVRFLRLKRYFGDRQSGGVQV
jgi:peptidoglycan/LPS O-acetylase OafA/YrhL